jgi:predicted PurR-regulated permease PerM
MQGNRLEQILAMLALAVLAIGCILVLWPFWSSVIWAVILCSSTWPLFMWLDAQFMGRRRNLSAALATLLMAFIFVLPFAIVGPSLAHDVTIVVREITGLLQKGPPEPPTWLRDVPWIGAPIADYWAQQIASGVDISETIRPFVYQAQSQLLALARAVGEGLALLLLSLIISFFLYRDGKTLAVRLSTAVERFAGERAQHLIELAGDTMRGVVYGIMGTALAQAALATIGFYIAGVNAALFLGLVTFFMALIPFGTPFVWVPVGLWLLAQDHIWQGAFLLAWGTLLISWVDNILKPYFISREGRLPFVLVFLGVLGGVVTFGFIGVFLGPVLLAIGFSLAKEWSASALAERLEREGTDGDDPPATL